MKLENLSLADNKFVDAEIITDAGTINVGAEISPDCPMHIENAVWQETGDDALGYIAQHFDTVRGIIKAGLPPNA